MAETVEERLKKLTAKVDVLKTQKIRAERELELKRQEHTNLVKELKEKGVTNIDDLPNLIIQLEEKFNTELSNAEKEVVEIESKITSV
jgi:predicted  nucleic acid-binding Zn-ribbon protein